MIGFGVYSKRTSYRLALILALFVSAFAQGALATAAPATPKELILQRITPDGNNVPAAGEAARQIVLQFNRPVVPLGQMEREASKLPISIVPEVNCHWRWLNTSALACDLDEKDALKPSTTYEITVKPGITAEDGETMAAPFSQRFTTERADITYAYLQQWLSPTHPVVRIALNQPVTKSSLETHLYYALPPQLPNARVAITATPYTEPEESAPFWIALENRFLGLFKPAEDTASKEIVMVNGEEARRVWLIEPSEELAEDSSYTLRMEPGIVSADGPEKTISSRDVRTLDTFPAFTFKGVQCTSNAGEVLRFAPGEPLPQTSCNPLNTTQLIFSSPVFESRVAKFFHISPPLAGWSASSGAWDTQQDYSLLTTEYSKGKEFLVWLPEYLKASKHYNVQFHQPDFFARLWSELKGWFDDSEATEFTDQFGRTLTSPVELTFTTDHRKPNFELPYEAAVLEKGVESEIPLWVTNLEKYQFDFQALDYRGQRKNQSFSKTLPVVQDKQFAVPFGLREMLEGQSGALNGIFVTTPMVTDQWDPTAIRTKSLFAQVTPYDVHLKLGHFQSLVWVTDFATGKPVEGATVQAYIDSISELRGPKKVLAAAVTNAQGVAILPGSESLDPDLEFSRVWQQNSERLFFIVRKENEQAVLPVYNNFEVGERTAGDEYLSTYNQVKYAHMRSWGMTAQGVYRVGETIDYKIYVRQDDGTRLIAPPSGHYRLEVRDPTGKIVHKEKDVKLSTFGSYSGQFTVPKKGAVGWYQFELHAKFEKNSDGNPRTFQTSPMNVLVADFTPSPFRVSNEMSGDLFNPDQTVEVTTNATMHAGGPYTDAAMRVTAILDATDFYPKSPVLKGFSFDTGNSPYSLSAQLYQTDAQINDKGENHLSFTLTPQEIVYGKLTVESAVQDDRGKSVTSRAQADYSGAERFAGLRSSQWVLEAGKEAVIEVAVANDKGVPAGDIAPSVKIEKMESKAARVKGAGNAYLTQFETEWVTYAECQPRASLEPQPCRFTPKQAGSYRAIATIKDQKGHTQTTTLALWVTGGDYVLWDDGNSNTLDVMPQSKDLKVGDTARYLVKNPFPGAQALITVERYGVIDHLTQTLEGSSPIIEIPVKPDYVPGFYVSVTVVSPRVADKPFGGPGEVDLGKPALRMGYAAAIVNDPYKEMIVEAKTDKETYRPRDTVTLSLHTEPKKPANKEPIELAVVVLDEAVFDLITGGKNYFNPYKGFYHLDTLDLKNYNLIMQLIGRQKFEKKGANPGGDGGADLAMRNMFKFVSYWNPSVPLDDKGNAQVKFDVPDNLTGWRVLAMAVTPTDRMGLGDANFKVNRPTEIRPVMPNQVMEGDQFKAGFSVMNRTDKPRDISVSVDAEGTLEEAARLSSTVHLEPFKRETIWLPLKAGKLAENQNEDEGFIHFTAEAGDASDRDGATHSLPVKKYRALETAATYGTTTDDTATESIAFPKDMHADVGAISVELSPSVIGNIAGAFGYVRDYPYVCWEQRLTKAIAAGHFNALHEYLPKKLLWKESTKLAAETLAESANYQAPSGGMAYFIGTDDYADPYLSAYTALGFNWLRQMGQTIPSNVESSLQAYLQRFLKQDVAPSYYSAGMASTVRAVALAALADQGKVTLTDLGRYQPHLKEMSLFGKTHYVLAALKLHAPSEVVRPVVTDILSHMNQSGGKVTFNETLDDGYSRILASPMRENCAILEALTLYAGEPEGEALVGDLPVRLVRSITQTRGTRDHWENTQENLFCMNALLRYSERYEAARPAMKVKVALEAQAMGEAGFNSFRDSAVTLSHPIEAQDLGRNATLNISRAGTGRLYYNTRLQFSPTGEANKPVNAGMEVVREYALLRDGVWKKMEAPFTVKRGERVLVDLYVSLPTARTYVVVDDPVPGGLEPVNRDLATSSSVDADSAEFKRSEDAWFFRFNDWINYDTSRWSFYHQELRHDSVRFYSDYLPAGKYHLSYMAQAIAEGEFSLLPMKAEEMYDPDIFGKTASTTLKVVSDDKPAK